MNVPNWYHSYNGSNNDASVAEGGWEASSLRAYLDDDFYNLMPSDLRSVIQQVNKRTSDAGGNVTSANRTDWTITTTQDRFWALSLKEAYGAIKHNSMGDIDGGNETYYWGSWSESTKDAYYSLLNQGGEQYQLYRNCGVTDTNEENRVLQKDDPKNPDSGTYWWLRSSDPGYVGAYCVYTQGTAGNYWNAYVGLRVAPGFCI